MVTDREITIYKDDEKFIMTQEPVFVEEIKGFDTLEVNLVTAQGFDQDGSTMVNMYTSDRPMEISGKIYADTTWKMQELRNKFFDFFIPKTQLKIKHSYGGVTRTINVYTQKTPEFALTKVSKLQEYKIKLLAADPYWREEKDALVEMAGTKGRFHFALVIPKRRGVIFGLKSRSKIADVPNKSSIKTGMAIVFTAKGTVVNPYVVNIYTRECIQINCTMTNGQVITIQTGKDKTITSRVNGVTEDYLGHIDIAGGNCTFLELSPGDNILRYGAEEGENYMGVKFIYSSGYTGV